MDHVRWLIRELHRRSVWQVLAIYFAGSWIALQVVETLVETLQLPEWSPGVAFVLLVVGLPIVLATAFVQEGTGFFGNEHESAGESEGGEPGSDAGSGADPNLDPATKAGNEAALSLFTWKNAIGGGIAAFALWGVLAAGWLLFGNGFEAADRGSEGRSATGESSSAEVRTIAVLPFQNMSGTEETKPFTIGIHDDILTQLSKIGALQVTSRTSVMDYRDSPKPIREIAEELGVATILEGGVQSSAGRVRINVQLIDAGSDRHLWAETYDRELTAENVFDIQSEIALNVAEALRAELAPEEQAAIVAIPTTDLDALALYHRGRELFGDRTDPQSALEAETVLESAVGRDPEFAAAWAELAKARSWLLGWGSADELGTEQALERTSVLSPGSFETEMAEGFYQYYGERSFRQALEHFDAAAALRPTDIDAIQARALILRRLGRWDESVAAFERAAVLDPRSSSVLRMQAETLGMLRRYDQAFQWFERAVQLDPAAALTEEEFVEFAVAAGDTARASKIMRTYGLVDRPEAWRARLLMADARRDYEAALDVVQGIPTSDVPLSEALRFWYNGYYNQLLGNDDSGRAYGDSLQTLLENFETPFAAARELFTAQALVLAGRDEEARAATRVCLEQADPRKDQVEGTIMSTYCLWTLAAAGAPDEAIDGLLEIAPYPNRDLTVGRLEHVSWFQRYLGENPRFPELMAKLREVERQAAQQ